MRKPIIAGNWKMNLSPREGAELIKALAPLVKDAECDVVACPPFVDLPAVCRAAEGTRIHIGAQNIHWADKGAFTGEISAPMLKELGVEYAIIGHSERRQFFGETDEGVNKRAKAALAAGITPIICVGESLIERENGETEKVVSSQTAAALSGIDESGIGRVVLAYEPIWAIGTGRTATSKQADDTIGTIRDVVRNLYGENVSEKLRIQYGGSMNPKNAGELMSMPNIDGGLIGGASLKAQDFAEIIALGAKAKAE